MGYKWDLWNKIRFKMKHTGWVLDKTLIGRKLLVGFCKYSYKLKRIWIAPRHERVFCRTSHRGFEWNLSLSVLRITFMTRFNQEPRKVLQCNRPSNPFLIAVSAFTSLSAWFAKTKAVCYVYRSTEINIEYAKCITFVKLSTFYCLVSNCL